MFDGERLQVVGHQRRQRDDLLEVGLDVALQRVDLELSVVLELLRAPRLTRARRYGPRRRSTSSRRTRARPWTMMPQAAVGQLEHLVDVAGGADRVQIVLLRLVFGRLALGEHAQSVCRRRPPRRSADGALARHGERHEGIAETARCRGAAAPAARRRQRNGRRRRRSSRVRSLSLMGPSRCAVMRWSDGRCDSAQPEAGRAGPAAGGACDSGRIAGCSSPACRRRG